MQPVSLTCPQCGAPLPRSVKRRAVNCEHCGSRLEPEASEAPRDSDGPASTSAPEQTGGPLSFPAPQQKYVSLIAALVPLLGIGMSFFFWWLAQPQPASPRPVVTAPAPVPREPLPPTKPAGPPLLVSPGLLLVPDSGAADDLVAVFEEASSPEKRWLGAFDGDTGEVRWRWPLDRDPELADAPRALVDGTLLVTSPSTVYALSVETGEVSWSRDTGGRPEGLCSGKGFAGLSFANQRFVAFSVATGSSVRGRPDACAEALTSRSVAPNFSIVEGGAVALPPRGRAPLDVQRALIPHKGTARVLLGTDASGLARVAVASREAWLWDARLGRADADRARLLSPPLAAVRNERVVVPYILTNPAQLRLASLDLETGRLVWDEALTTRDVESRAPRAELRLSRAGTIYLSNGKGQLWVVAIDSQPLWKLGER